MSIPSESRFQHESLKKNLPLTVRGSEITSHRVTGHHSVVFPTLRDLADAADEALIDLEIDTKKGRTVGLVHKIHPSFGSEREGIYLRIATPGGQRRERLVYLEEVIAFRVLSVKVKEIPANL